MGILVFLFLGIIVLINIISLIFSDEVMKKNKRSGFLFGLSFNGATTIFCFIGGLSGDANFHAGGIFPAFCLLGFWFFYVFALINALALFGKTKKIILYIIVSFALFPSYLFISEAWHRYKFYEVCENDYEYKIHKKIQLPRQYFHLATKKEADKRKTRIRNYDYVPENYLRIEEGDLVANTEQIELKDILKNIREKKIFKQDRVYVISSSDKKCNEIIRDYKNINWDEYGYFICPQSNYSRYKYNMKRHLSHMYLNTDEILAHVNSYNYSYFGKLRKFIISNKRIECSKRPISIWSRDLIELKK